MWGGSIDRNQSWEQYYSTRAGLGSITVQRSYSVAIDTADWLSHSLCCVCLWFYFQITSSSRSNWKKCCFNYFCGEYSDWFKLKPKQQAPFTHRGRKPNLIKKKKKKKKKVAIPIAHCDHTERHCRSVEICNECKPLDSWYLHNWDICTETTYVHKQSLWKSIKKYFDLWVKYVPLLAHRQIKQQGRKFKITRRNNKSELSFPNKAQKHRIRKHVCHLENILSTRKCANAAAWAESFVRLEDETYLRNVSVIYIRGHWRSGAPAPPLFTQEWWWQGVALISLETTPRVKPTTAARAYQLVSGSSCVRMELSILSVCANLCSSSFSWFSADAQTLITHP